MPGDTIFTVESEFDVEGELPDSVDETAIERMRTVATVLDESIRVPGTSYRVGLDPLLGIAPVSGDVVSGAIGLYIIAESARLGVTYTTILEMLANVALDVAVGSIPLAGGIFDAVWKANKRNVELALRDLASGSTAGSRADSTDEREVVEIPVE